MCPGPEIHVKNMAKVQKDPFSPLTSERFTAA